MIYERMNEFCCDLPVRGIISLSGGKWVGSPGYLDSSWISV